MIVLLRCLLAGLATGGRSLSAVTLCAHSPGSTWRVDRALHGTRARKLLAVAAPGEVIADKLPVAPPRTQPPSVVFRLALGGLSGAVIAERGGRGRAAGAVLGAAGAAVTTFTGPTYRRASAARFGSDLPCALLEDAAAFGLATLATR